MLVSHAIVFVSLWPLPFPNTPGEPHVKRDIAINVIIRYAFIRTLGMEELDGPGMSLGSFTIIQCSPGAEVFRDYRCHSEQSVGRWQLIRL